MDEVIELTSSAPAISVPDMLDKMDEQIAVYEAAKQSVSEQAGGALDIKIEAIQDMKEELIAITLERLDG